MAKKKPKQGTLTRKCDRLFSQYIRQRDGYCQSGRHLSEGCDGQYNLQCAHGFSRRYFATRWEEWNAWALCRACHVFFTHRPLEWEEWLTRQWGGPGGYMVRRQEALKKFTGDKVEIAAYYTEKLKQAA